MKKLMIGACAVLVLGAASCSKCGGDKCTPTNDSLSLVYGDYVGTMIHNEFGQFAGDDAQSKTEFLRGVQLVFGADTSANARIGMQVALQMMNEMAQLESQGIRMNRTTVLNTFKNAFLADSIPTEKIQNCATDFRMRLEAAREEAQAAQTAKKAAEPDAVENVKAGEEYVAKLKAENPEVKTLPSGLSYVIETPGEGARPDENATVVVNYTGKHLDGKVFDSSEGRGPATFPLQGVVAGFREGLMQLAKGGKATLYIPGELAYGPNGQPAAGIGPNEMLVFDVELLEIKAE